MFSRLAAISFVLIVGTLPAQAKVFDLNTESFAAYFGFTGGPSSIGKSAYENEAGAGVTFTNSVAYNYSGEFGFLYSRPSVSMRFGFEFLRPQLIENLVGRSSSSDLYSETSDILGYVPKFSMEFNLRKDQVSRSFVSASAGYATVTLKILIV